MLFLALIYLVFIGLGLPDSVLGAAWPAMQPTLHVPLSYAGFLSMTISCGTIISSLLSHRVIRRFGTGRVTLVSVATTALALLGFGLMPSFPLLFLCALPLGLGAGAVDAGLNEFIAEHYSARHMNWLHCFWGVGAMLGPFLMSMMLNASYGWRGGYLLIGGVQCVIVMLLFISQPAWMRFRASGDGESVADKKVKHSLLAPARLPGAPLALLSFFLYCGVEMGVGLWGASFLTNARGISAESAAGWISMFYLGITLGRLFSGVIVAKLSNEQLVRLGCLVTIVGLTLLLLPLPIAFAYAGLLLVGLGLAPIFPGLLHQTPVYFGTEHAQALMGMQMACAYTGTMLLPPVLGFVLERTSFLLFPYMLLTIAWLMLAMIQALRRKKNHKESIAPKP